MPGTFPWCTAASFARAQIFKERKDDENSFRVIASNLERCAADIYLEIILPFSWRKQLKYVTKCTEE